MNKSKKAFCVGIFAVAVTWNASAQKAPPFDDLPEDEPSQLGGSSKSSPASSQTTAKAAPKTSTAKSEVDDLEAELDKDIQDTPAQTDDLDKALQGDLVGQNPSELSPGRNTTPKNASPSAAKKPVEVEEEMPALPQTQAGQSVVQEPLPESENDPTLNPVVSEKDFQSQNADDIKDIEKKFEKEVMPKALIESGEDPGAGLPIEEKFYRVPLRPRMSDASWRRWAGPGLQKIYKIRRKDSLWAVSERLFGTPYLWPKVWHLNATVTNPNIIEPGIELQFNPGNPNSAPSLALIGNGASPNEPMPLLIQNKSLSLYEKLEQSLLMQVSGKNPPFKYFLVYKRPVSAGTLPAPENEGKLIWEEHDRFSTRAADGDYVIVRIRFSDEESIYGHRVQWVGTASVEARQATITQAFSEIQEGDILVDRNFQIAPASVHEDSLDNLSRRTKMVQLEESARSLIAENQLVGLVLPSSQTGPLPGSLLNVEKNKRKVATLLVIDRDQRMATGWVVESTEEFDYGASIQ